MPQLEEETFTLYECATMTRTQEEREELILEHLPQVNWIALRIHEKLPPGIELDDLISAGIVCFPTMLRK